MNVQPLNDSRMLGVANRYYSYKKTARVFQYVWRFGHYRYFPMAKDHAATAATTHDNVEIVSYTPPRIVAHTVETNTTMMYI